MIYYTRYVHSKSLNKWDIESIGKIKVHEGKIQVIQMIGCQIIFLQKKL